MSLRVLLRIEIKPGQEAEFEKLWRSHAEAIARLPENLGQRLLRSTAEPRSYAVETDWVDEPAFRTFEQTEAQQEYLKRLWPLRAGGSMTLFETVHVIAEEVAVP